MALSFLDVAMPYFNRMHEMTVDHAHEEIQLLAIDFSTMLLRDHGADADVARRTTWPATSAPATPTCRRVLKVLQWLRGGTRWVLKSPQHLEQFPALVDTFPDATFVVTHRDPVSVTTSMVTMLAYSARLTRDHVDVPSASGTTGPTGWSRCCARCAERPGSVLPAAQTIDVHFDEFMADDLAMVARVYEVAHQPLDQSSRDAMHAFMAEHPRGKFGAIEYDLSEFDLDPVECRKAFSFYSERFGVTREA